MGHGQRVFGGLVRGDRGACPPRIPAPRRRGAGDAHPPRNRLRGCVSDLPLRPHDSHRGDERGSARRGQGRQGTLSRGVSDVGVAVCRHATCCRPERLDSLCVDAGPVLSAVPRGGPGDVRPARQPRRRFHPPSPLAKGRVAQPWGTRTERTSNDKVRDDTFVPEDEPIAGAVERIAAERGIKMAQVALAWVLRNPRGVGAHHRRDQGGTRGRRSGGAGRETQRRRGRRAGVAVHATRTEGVLGVRAPASSVTAPGSP